MALGPLAKVVAQAALMGLTILARAIPAAYGAALQNAKKGGVDAARASEGVFIKKRMKLDEALMIMNLDKSDVTAETVQKVSNSIGTDVYCVRALVSLFCVFSTKEALII